jgi:hypothetical protein
MRNRLAWLLTRASSESLDLNCSIFRAQSTIPYVVVREAVRWFVDGALLRDAVPGRGHPRGSQGASKSPPCYPTPLVARPPRAFWVLSKSHTSGNDACRPNSGAEEAETLSGESDVNADAEARRIACGAGQARAKPDRLELSATDTLGDFIQSIGKGPGAVWRTRTS